MSKIENHWNEIFSSKEDPNLGWYEKDVSQTVKFLAKIPKTSDQKIFLPGAGTSLLVDKLIEQNYTLILNDISSEALHKLKERITNAENQQWHCGSIADPLPETIKDIDIWIDRAVLHFLLEEDDIEGYFQNIKSALKDGGYVLLAEFSTTGAPMCAGLKLHRYSLEEMCERMGDEFTLLDHEEYTFINPAGDPRPYIYALFQKK